MKKRTGVILLSLGLACLAGAVVAMAVGIMGFIDKLKPVAIVEAPGEITFQIDQPGTYPLWHDYSNWHGGTFHHYDSRPPSDFVYELARTDAGRAVPFDPLPRSQTQTMSSGRRESFGLGAFEVPTPGEYVLRASNPAGDQRHFSLTEGSFLGILAPFGITIGITVALGLAGLALFIIGLIGILAAKRKHPAKLSGPPPGSPVT